MPQNYWAVICNEPKAPGVWRTWLAENCVAIGWPPPKYRLEGPTDKPGWDSARAFAQRVLPGDIIIPYLLRYRFGIPGEVVKVAISDGDWNPTVAKGDYADNPDEPELGRRIHVKWLETGVPSQGKIAIVPPSERISGGMVKKTIFPLRPDIYARFIEIIRNPKNWQLYTETKPAEPATDEQPEPSTEPESGKLAIQETLLRSILAKNLARIEPGLKPHPEFPKLEEVTFDLGRLDLLCIDSKHRTTIIELQLGHLDDGHIGKVCRYFGWFAAKYPEKVRAILLYENTTQDVIDAYKKAVPWLELRKFALTADIKLESS